jgi:hypothetical protein
MRVREARLLLRGSEWSGAYYLVGYAVECALKARLARDFRAFRMPDKDDVNRSYTHDLEFLAKQAGLNVLIATAGGNLSRNWNVVVSWRETSRYETRTETQAREIFRAVTDRNDGVLPWLKQYW